MTIDQTTQSTDALDSRELLRVLTAVKKGDFFVRMPIDYTGIAGKIADTLNDSIELNKRMTNEFELISIVVGKEGRISQRAAIGGATGSCPAGGRSRSMSRIATRRCVCR